METYKNRDYLIKQYITNDLSISKIAKDCGVCLNTIHRYLIRFDIPRRPACCPPGEKSSRWKGGRIKQNGYIYIYNPGHLRATGNYVPEQIIVIEKFLKRKLTKPEAVHHINFNKLDNSIENLYLFKSESNHQKYHQKLRKGTCNKIIRSNVL